MTWHHKVKNWRRDVTCVTFSDIRVIRCARARRATLARRKLTVQGYEPVEFDGGTLKTYFKRLTTLTLPIAPDLRSLGGTDGTVTQLALFGSLCSQVRYQWWSNCPPGWGPLVKIADKMFKAFGGPEEVE